MRRRWFVLLVLACASCHLAVGLGELDFVDKGEGGSSAGGMGGDGGGVPDELTVGGSVSGLLGMGLVLQNNRGDDLAISSDGAFVFPTPLLDGEAYSVTVLTQPDNPVQTCAITGGSGAVDGAPIEDVVVTCAVPPVVDDLSASQLLVSPGDEVTLSWATQNATSCEISPGAIAATPEDAGTAIVTADATTEFTLTCTNAGGSATRSVDVEVTDDDWAQMSSGDAHTCAVKTDGRLFCWGDGGGGRLGNGSPAGSLVPVQEASLATDWAQVSAGSFQTCAVKTGGRLFCWGGGGSGLLGHGSNMGSLVPVQEASLADDWQQVSSGRIHTCATKSNGRLYCWGEGSTGALGHNALTDSNVPVQEASLATNWTHVTAGWDHTCAVRTDGRLYCWGEGSDGKLGNNSTGDRQAPAQENSLATDWKQVSAGIAHTCAVKLDGKLFCWGKGSSGQLGNDDTTSSLVPIREASTASDWLSVTTGNTHSCAVKTDGRLFCWGSGGALGHHATANQLVPVQESSMSSDWADAATWNFSTCGRTSDGRIFCWGAGESGQLGNGFSGDSLIAALEYSQANDWKQISTGSTHTCAVKADGRLFCWGNGGNGRLGHNSTSGSLVPVREYSLAIDWSHVAAGGSHACAIKSDGRLFCWGAGNLGQLANNSLGESHVPVQEASQASDWKQVASGLSHSCALKINGRLFCWGLNGSGQLGDDSTSDSPVPIQESSGATDWEQVSAGLVHTCAVKTDGRLFCWGNGGVGRLGDNSTNDSHVPVQEDSLASDWAVVAAGGSHTCAVKLDGRLFCWGYGADGQLGGNTTANSLVPARESSMGTDWARVSTGGNHSCGATNGGEVFCWGNGADGQLGSSSSEDSVVPLQEAYEAAIWSFVAAGGNHSCGLKSDGRLFCWGSGTSGQLGIGLPLWPVLPAD